MKREKVVVRRKNDASGQRLECVQIRQSAQKQRTATQTAQTILVGGISCLQAQVVKPLSFQRLNQTMPNTGFCIN